METRSTTFRSGVEVGQFGRQRNLGLGRVVRFVGTDPPGLAGMIILAVVLLLTIVSPLLVPYDPVTASPRDILLPPNASHWFGTDNLGMDIFSRVIVAPRVDLVIVASAVLAVSIGVPLGVASGFYHGVLAESISRVADVVQTFPAFVLAMAIVAMTGQNIWNVIFVIAAINSPIYLRLMRGQTYALRERLYIEAARCAGNRDWQVVYRHLVPNAIGPAVAQFSINIGWAMLLTAGLGFVGAGVRVPTPEWGLMVASGAQNMITGQWWIAFFPGVALGLTVLGFALMGDAFERYFARGQ